MAIEIEQIPNLEVRQRELSIILEQRHSAETKISERIETAKSELTGANTVEDLLRSERITYANYVRSRVTNSRAQIKDQLTQISSTLETLIAAKNEEQLQAAEAYLQELAVREGLIAALRKRAAYADPADLELRQSQHNEFKARAEQDLNLKHGLSMLEAKKQAEEKANTKSRFKVLSAEDLARLDEEAKAAKKITQTEPNTDPDQLRENTLMVLSTILDNPDNLTLDEILEAMGDTKAGRRFTWVQTTSSIYNLSRTLYKRISQNSNPVEHEVEIWDKIVNYVNIESADPFEIRKALKVKLTELFKNGLPKSANTAPEGEDKTETEDEVTIDALAKKAQRVQEIESRVEAILNEMAKIENFPSQTGGAKLTKLIQEHMGLRITDTQMAKAVERKYVQTMPSTNGHHTPEFDQEAAIVLIYINKFGNNLKPTQKKELKSTIKKMYTAWKTS